MAFYLVLSSQPAVLIQSLEFALGTGGCQDFPPELESCLSVKIVPSPE